MRWNEIKQGYKDQLDAMRQKAPHEILGVNPSCGVDEVKVAYRKLVKAYHPDTSDPFMKNHNEEAIKLINGAYKNMLDQYSK
jgi:DnaJ-class molecular chaperone